MSPNAKRDSFAGPETRRRGAGTTDGQGLQRGAGKKQSPEGNWTHNYAHCPVLNGKGKQITNHFGQLEMQAAILKV